MGDSHDSTITEPLSNVITKTDKVVFDLVEDDAKCSSSVLSANEDFNADKGGVSAIISKQDEQDNHIPSPVWIIADWEGLPTSMTSNEDTETVLIIPSKKSVEESMD